MSVEYKASPVKLKLKNITLRASFCTLCSIGSIIKFAFILMPVH